MKNKFIFPLIFLMFFCTISHANLNNLLTNKLSVVSVTEIQRDSNYVTQVVKLNHPLTGHFNLFKKQSLQGSGPQPVLFVVTGAAPVTPLVNMGLEIPGATVLALDYNVFTNGEVDTEKFFREISKIQSMIVLTLLHLSSNPEYDSNKISVFSVSMGAYILPYGLRLAEELGFKPAATVFAFAGATFTPYLDKYSDQVRLDDKTRRELYKVLEMIEPVQQLKYLKGPFLVISGKEDTVIPVESGLALEAGLSEPKMLIKLDVPHIGINKKEVIDLTLIHLFSFLKQQSAI